MKTEVTPVKRGRGAPKTQNKIQKGFNVTAPLSDVELIDQSAEKMRVALGLPTLSRSAYAYMAIMEKVRKDLGI